MKFKRYRLTYHLANGKIIRDIKEFYYKDKSKMLERVIQHVTKNERITAIDSTGSLIPIRCNEIVKVQLNHLG